jgi:hypothetical protein
MTLTSRTKVLRNVEKLITKDREDTHGAPLLNLSCEADFLINYLETRGIENASGAITIDAFDVAIMSILKKIARIASGDRLNTDHTADIVGYAALAYEFAVDREVE